MFLLDLRDTILPCILITLAIIAVALLLLVTNLYALGMVNFGHDEEDENDEKERR